MGELYSKVMGTEESLISKESEREGDNNAANNV